MSVLTVGEGRSSNSGSTIWRKAGMGFPVGEDSGMEGQTAGEPLGGESLPDSIITVGLG